MDFIAFNVSFIKGTLRRNRTKVVDQFQYLSMKRVNHHGECQGNVETKVGMPLFGGRIYASKRTNRGVHQEEHSEPREEEQDKSCNQTVRTTIGRYEAKYLGKPV